MHLENKYAIILTNKVKGLLKMKQYSQVKHQSLETFVNNLNDLSVELVIDSALRENRKRELAILIDEALVNRNNELFDQYSEELIQLEDLQS